MSAYDQYWETTDLINESVEYPYDEATFEREEC